MTTFAYPLRKEIKGNIALTTDKTPLAFYKIESESLTLVDFEKAERVKHKVGLVLEKFEVNKGFEIDLVPFDLDLHEKMEKLIEISDPQHENIVLNHAMRTEQSLIQELIQPYEYKWILSVPLPKTELSADFKESMKNKYDEVVESFVNGFGLEVALEKDWEKELLYKEKEVFQSLNEFHVERLTESEIQRIQGEQFVNYIPHSADDILSVGKLDNLLDTKIEVKFNGMLEMQHANGVSYVDILPLGDMGFDLRNANVLSYLQLFDFPIHAKFQAKFAEKKGALALAGRSARGKSRLKGIAEETEVSGGVQKKKIISSMLTLNDLDEQIDNNEPVLDWSGYFIIAGRTKAECRDRRKALLNSFHNNKISLYRATFDNPYLFQQTLYGQFLLSENKKWRHTSTVKSFARMDFFTTQRAGNDIGYYFGRVDLDLSEKINVNAIVQRSNKLIFRNFLLSNKNKIRGKRTNNPHVAVTGVTGGGKSVMCKRDFIEVIKLGAKALYIDPKKEMRKEFIYNSQNKDFQYKYPEMVELIEKINFVTLDNTEKSNLGVLDPIVMFEREKALEVTKSILTYITPPSSPYTRKESAVLYETIAQVIQARQDGDKVGLWHVVDLLMQDTDEEIQILGRYIRSMVQGSVLELCFSYGDVKGLSFDEQATVLEIENLDLPKEREDNISDNQRLSVALMFALGTFCEYFGKRDRTEETVIFFDEAWIFLTSDSGKKVLKSMLRVGRSMNNFLYFISQSVDDLRFSKEEGMEFGEVICFSEKKPEKILDFMEIPIDENSIKWVSNMAQGQCIFRDMFFNINRIAIHILFEEYLLLFKTVDDTKASLQVGTSF
ncbi:AAA-like domain-containing protein [Pilibacter termitis]|uniref:AAA-like domain-containing protein n=1 Tax=Pilibacter termitis TaxID=263852 RepID=A0A1T4NF28_9ENTE|nr:ATP-binding protein [Pilibacter termitis]SJZ77870.1 AAA-like domain-containing protein [Pilibacter termitis]